MACPIAWALSLPFTSRCGCGIRIRDPRGPPASRWTSGRRSTGPPSGRATPLAARQTGMRRWLFGQRDLGYRPRVGRERLEANRDLDRAGGPGCDRHDRNIEPDVRGAKTCQAGFVISRGIVCSAGLFLIPVRRCRYLRCRRSSVKYCGTRLAEPALNAAALRRAGGRSATPQQWRPRDVLGNALRLKLSRCRLRKRAKGRLVRLPVRGIAWLK
jgi:hypothetical protein